MNLVKILAFFLVFFMSGFFSLLEGQIDNDFKNSIDLFQNKLYSLAHVKFSTLIENSQNISIKEESYYYTALSSYYSKNFYNALSEFTSLLINFPNTKYYKSVKKYTAMSYFYLKNYVYAINGLKNYMKEFPHDEESASLNFLIAQSYFYMGYYDKALQLLEIMKNGQTIDDSIRYRIMFLIGHIRFYEKNYEEALKTFNVIISRSSDPYLINYSLFSSGIINFYMNEKEESIRLFNSIKKNTGIDENLLLISDLFTRIYNNNMTESFLEEFTVNIKDKELLNFTYLNLINIYVKKQQFDKARKSIERGLELNLAKDHYYQLLAKINIIQNNFQEAESYLIKLINEYPQSLLLNEALFNLGIIVFQNNDYKRAKEYFIRIIDQNPELELNVLTSYKLGEIEYYNKDFNKAREYFQSAINSINSSINSLDNNSSYLKKTVFYLSEILTAAGNDGDNINLLEKYYKEINDYSLQYRLALSYFNTKKYPRSVNLIKDILDNSNDARLNYKTFLILVKIADILSDEKDFNDHLLKLKNNQYVSENEYINFIIKLSSINIKNKNYKEAEKNLMYATTLKPSVDQRKQVYYYLYQSYKNLGQTDKAVKSLDILIKDETDKEKIEYFKKLRKELQDENNR